MAQVIKCIVSGHSIIFDFGPNSLQKMMSYDCFETVRIHFIKLLF